MHSSRMRTVRNSSRLLWGGGLHTHTPLEQTVLGAATPRGGTPQDLLQGMLGYHLQCMLG